MRFVRVQESLKPGLYCLLDLCGEYEVALLHASLKGRPRTDARATRGLHQVPQIQRESVREEQSADKWVELSNAQRVNSAVLREAVNDS